MEFGCWYLGLYLAVLSNIFGSVGFTLLRWSHLHNLRLPEEEQRSDCARPMYVAGALTYLLSTPLEAVAYMMVPQILCATLRCSRLPLTTILSRIFLDGQMRASQILGVSLCMLGSVCCMLSAPTGQTMEFARPSGDLAPKVLIYMLASVVVILVLMWIECTSSRCPQPQWQILVIPFLSSYAWCLEKVLNTELGFAPSLQDLWLIPKWAAMVFGILAIGVFEYYYSFRGLKKLPVQVFVAITFAFTTPLQYLQSLVILDEFQTVAPTQAALAMTGAIVALIGGMLVTLPTFDQPVLSTTGTDLKEDLLTHAIPEERSRTVPWTRWENQMMVSFIKAHVLGNWKSAAQDCENAAQLGSA